MIDLSDGNGPAEKHRKNKGHENIRPHQWEKGQSGNPAGRPKGKTLGAILQKRVFDDKGGELAERLVELFINEALGGKFPFAKEVIERIDGKVAQAVDVSALMTADDVAALPRERRIEMLESALEAERAAAESEE